MITVNTLRALCERLYGESYTLQSKYDMKGKPQSWKTLYTVNGTHWMYGKELAAKLENACQATGR